jgi:tetratricopeptide (TPR) repeat protein
MRSDYCIIFILFLAMSCETSIHKKLDKIELQINHSPDSAIVHLEELSLKQMLTHNARARYALLTSMALDKNYIDVTDDSLINIAVNYYSDSKAYPKYKLLAYYYKGIVHKNAGNYSVAIVYFDKAGELAKSLNNMHYLGLVYRNIADVFNLTNNIPEATKYCQKAINAFSMNSSDSLYLHYAQYSLSVDLMEEGLYEQSRSILSGLWHNADSALRAYCNLCYAQSLVMSRDSTLKARELYHNTPFSYYDVLDYAYYALTFLDSGNCDSAKFWIERSHLLARSNEERATLYYLQAEIDSACGLPYEALRHIRTAANVQDSLTRVLLTQSLSIAQRDYYRQEADIQNLRVKRQKALMAVWSIVGALIALLTFLFFKQKASQKEQALQNTIAQLEIEKYKSEKATSELVGTLFLEKYAHLGTLADSCFGNDGKETLDSFKKDLSSLGNNTSAFTDLYKMLDSYADGVLQKFKKQLPALSKSNLKLISLFFAGIPDEITQYIMRRQSVGSLKTFRSRLRETIKQSDCPDKQLFLSYLERQPRKKTKK